MNTILRFLLITFSFHPFMCFSNTPELAWEVSDLANPESVVYEEKRKLLFFSNQHYGDKNGSGSIGLMSLDGKMVKRNWVTGLNEPKGIGIRGNRLFVTDIKSLIEIDIDRGRIVKKYKAPGARFLNDIAVTKKGEVFVSDMFTSSIYKLSSKGVMKIWLNSPELENPNGLLSIGNKLLISGWGTFSNDKPLTAKKGRLIQVNIDNKKITKLMNSPLGNLDGIEVYKDHHYFVSDWVNGSIYLIDNKYKAKRILELEQSVGDILFLKREGLLLAPMAKQGRILAYRVSEKLLPR